MKKSYILCVLFFCVSLYAESISPLSGKFSISSTKKVQFAPGNLQFHMKDSIWKFADSQYDIIGSANFNCGDSTYNGYIDLFNLSIDGHYYGVETYQSSFYYDGSFIDWGEVMGEGWFTLNINEWMTIERDRKDASKKHGIAIVDSIGGYVLLPDDWKCPDSLTFTCGFSTSKTAEAYGQFQSYTALQWKKMEEAGAVFLPATGYRDGTNVWKLGTNGRYWSSSKENPGMPESKTWWYMEHTANGFGCKTTAPNYGLSVRLVKLVEEEPTDLSINTLVQSSSKYIKDGEIIIRKGNNKYNILGVRLE